PSAICHYNILTFLSQFLLLSLSDPAANPLLLSFPTRRSSDLIWRAPRTRTWQAPPRPPRRRARRPLLRSAFGLRGQSRVVRGRGCTGATRTAPGRLSRAGAHHRTHPSRRTGRSAACSGSSRSPVSADPIAFEVGGAQARRRAVRYTEGPRPTRVCLFPRSPMEAGGIDDR